MQNDPTGVYAEARREFRDAWEDARLAALSDDQQDPGTLKADRASRNATLAAQIARDGISCKWGRVEFKATVQDGQSALVLEPGGQVMDATVTLVTSKEFFRGGKYPVQQHTIKILLPPPINKWAPWVAVTVSGQHDTTDGQLTLVLEPDDASDDQQ